MTSRSATSASAGALTRGAVQQPRRGGCRAAQVKIGTSPAGLSTRRSSTSEEVIAEETQGYWQRPLAEHVVPLGHVKPVAPKHERPQTPMGKPKRT